MSEQLAGHDVALSYRVDPELHRVIVEVVDRKDGIVLRQIPGEEALRLDRLMNSGQGGLLLATVCAQHDYHDQRWRPFRSRSHYGSLQYGHALRTEQRRVGKRR